MRKLEINETTEVLGGDWLDRVMKQWYKCANGSSRDCERVNRMVERHLDDIQNLYDMS